jgi:hypothetical protein
MNFVVLERAEGKNAARYMVAEEYAEAEGLGTSRMPTPMIEGLRTSRMPTTTIDGLGTTRMPKTTNRAKKMDIQKVPDIVMLVFVKVENQQAADPSAIPGRLWMTS